MTKEDLDKRSVDPASLDMLRKIGGETRKRVIGEVEPAPFALIEKPFEAGEKVTTMWERYQNMQPQCGFGDLGLCCRICNNGPCRINPFGKEPSRGICGATDYTIASRNLIRMIAGGCSAHSDHARHVVHAFHALTEGKAPAYTIKGPEKLRKVAERVGIDLEGKEEMELAKELVEKAFGDYSRTDEDGVLTWTKTIMTKKRMDILDFNDVLPYNIDATVTEVMHRTHVGVDAGPVPLIFDGVKCAVADLAGEHISTDFSDIMFGTPKLVKTEANLGTIKEDYVNIAIHGHNPILSEVVCDVADRMEEEAKAAGAKGINIVGICCTGAELLMRRGIPLAASFSAQELAITTGALDAMVIDYQCIMPSLGSLCSCYHTKLISTSRIARQVGDMHIEFNPETAEQSAEEIVRIAIEAYKNRNPSQIYIPEYKVDTYAGFSVEQIEDLLKAASPDDPWGYMVDALKSGKLKGIAAFVGCNNVKVPENRNHLIVGKEAVKNDILVVATGCSAAAYSRAGLMTSEATEEYAGEGLKSFLKELSEKAGLEEVLPSFWHMGSCVDNSRIHDLATAIANRMGLDVKDLPVVAGAPENMSEKAVAIGTWMVLTGWPTYVAIIPYIEGSPLVMEVAQNTTRDVYGGFFLFEKDPEVAAQKLVNIVYHRRWRLGIEPDTGVYWNGTSVPLILEADGDGGDKDG
jgi:carbon-monoxide dehydrogenase catalytic subunit